MSTREEIMTRMSAIKPRKVTVGGLQMHVRPMSLACMMRVRKYSNEGREDAAMLQIILGSVCDAEGNLLFSEADVEQIEQWPSDLLSDLILAINEGETTEAEASGN
jgi:hypothetical protein